jgi:GR25 family glycosyltransferase involved in LPS biosynthesis
MFIDAASFQLCKRVAFTADQRYDLIVEAVWGLTPQDRQTCAKHVVLFMPYAPIMYDMESCVYQWNPTVRNFQNLSAIWTYDHFESDDIKYIEFLSGVPVHKIPYVWDADAIDAFVKENALPAWSDSAKMVEQKIPANAPPMLSWSARIMESNFSNCSHCTIPLCIVSQIRVQGDPIRFTVHNGETTAKHEFFKGNIQRNLLLPDISGNMVPRVRLPDLLREKTFVLAHQRFRPLKSVLLDAMYVGIPMIHNCAKIRGLGAPYYYELNQISGALEAWKQLKADYAANTGFFASQALAARKAVLRSTFSPQALAKDYAQIAVATTTFVRPVKPLSIPPAVTPGKLTRISLGSKPIESNKREIRVAFTDLWSEFQPKYNFFMYLLSWYTSQSQVKIVLDQERPDIVFFGSERSSITNREVESKYPGVPKVFFTGENERPNAAAFLNLGFDYNNDANYVRLPLWNLYINWFGANPDKIVNPKPVDLAACLTVDKALVEKKGQFCAFVVSNPTNPNRNATFHGLNEWKPVVSAGRLFCNRPEGPLTGGMGGGGGEQVKVDFYKDFQFAITFENSTNPGYTTEKLFHAKVAGAIPIYWGDPHVDRDFDSSGFLNMNQATGVKDVVNAVKTLLEDPKKREAMALVPALSQAKKQAIQTTFLEVARRIVGKVLPDVAIHPPSWESAQSYGAIYEGASQPSAWIPVATETPVFSKRIFITAADTKYVEAAANALASLRAVDKQCEKIVYVWPDVPETAIQALKQCGATEVRCFPVTEDLPWADFWSPQHYAWKLWALTHANQAASPGSLVLYCDAGTAFAAPMDALWKQVEKDEIFLLEDDEQSNARWCHPTFNKEMVTTQLELAEHQLWAGGLGFKAGGKYADLWKEALTIAQKQPDVIRGDKWQPYSDICKGHRHDQSILSILTSRRRCPRQPLRSYYSDKSFRDSKRTGTPLYVHRGQYKEFTPFVDGIGEVYVVNLERRPDRLQIFKDNHPMLRNKAYVSQAVDGRALTLTPQLCHAFRNNDFKWKKAVMGCALSHLALWEQLANDSACSSFLILEDDVKLDADWLAKWAQVAPHVPADTDILFLGGVLPPNKPALPMITEPVNSHVALVRRNALFGGGERRYFHFCTYSYILTKQGAQKLVKFVKERGIFTSIDHMMVNHGDELFRIYFTTPLLATCTQENDPIYQKSEFNNFARVDSFDSDLWNNTDCFSEAEVMTCLAQPLQNAIITHGEEPVRNTDNPIELWNSFLQQVASDPTKIGATIESIFRVWKTMDHAAFMKNYAWFRIFDQLLRQQQPALIPHQKRIAELLQTTFTGETAATVQPLLAHLTGGRQKVIYYVPGVDISCMLEFQWLEELIGTPLTFQPWSAAAASDPNPFFFYYVPRSSHDSGPRMIAEFNKLITQWMLERKAITLIHMSDEFGQDDISFYNLDAIKKVFRNYWRPDLGSYGTKVSVLPLGYAKDRQGVTGATSSFVDRPHLWSFAGSLDRPKRCEALLSLRKAGPYVEKAAAKWGDPNLSAEDYKALLQKTKFVPCFPGSKAAESFRMYEALEHGAIPIYVPSDTGIQGCKDEWKEVLGQHPFLGFPSWEKAAELLPLFLKQTDAMEQHRQACVTWWREKKAALKASFQDSLLQHP